jgi:predicted ATPase with chaperone activity
MAHQGPSPGSGLLLIGPPLGRGAGKTLLAQRLPGFLPPMTISEALEVACLESLAGRRLHLQKRRPEMAEAVTLRALDRAP